MENLYDLSLIGACEKVKDKVDEFDDKYMRNNISDQKHVNILGFKIELEDVE